MDLPELAADAREEVAEEKVKAVVLAWDREEAVWKTAVLDQ